MTAREKAATGSRSPRGAWRRWPSLVGLLRRALGLGLGDGDLGARGEELAAAYLRGQGYEILARNYRVRGGEADLIARRGPLVVVVEVKARRSLRFGAPVEAVDRRKSRRVLRAGRLYCRSNGVSVASLRGDVVAVDWPPEGGEPRLRHWPSVLTD